MSMLFDKNLKPTFGIRIFVNISIWLCVAIFVITFNSIRYDDWIGTAPIEAAAEDFAHFLDKYLFMSLLAASILLHSMYSLIAQQTNDALVASRLKSIVQVLLEEWSTVVLNFGSLSLTFGTLSLFPAFPSHNYWLILFAPACYFAASWLRPKENLDDSLKTGGHDPSPSSVSASGGSVAAGRDIRDSKIDTHHSTKR